MKNQEWSPAELKTKIEAYCAAAEHCEMEARMRLRQWKCDSQNEDEIIDYLIAENFISDERYAKAFVHDKLLYQGWGRVKIAYMLRGKKIASDIIQSAIQTIDEEEYSRILNRLVSQRLPQNQQSSIDKSTLDSIYRFLLQRGFTLEEIKSAIHNP
jgi:regulatory protein